MDYLINDGFAQSLQELPRDIIGLDLKSGCPYFLFYNSGFAPPESG
jgi:hypothetical protein